jgi:phospholipase C
MAHLTRNDIPFHYALADAFTICDAYHCSLLGPTDPNRYYMWTGWVGNNGAGGGPVIDNAEAGYDWSTYPELLQNAGVSWKIYQDVGTGLTVAGEWGFTSDAYIGNYRDNSLLYFHQYQNALPGSPLYEKAKTGTNISAGGSLFDIFQKDVLDGNLPQVSWIVAPEAYSEHPNWPANYGAWYVSQVLDALTANPEVWSKTAFFLTFDENDGFFDHMVPPSVPPSRSQGLSTIDTTNELFAGDSEFPPGPYGLGVRVPMTVISPWSKGGWVNSELFDHTSLIKFIEQCFGPRYGGLRENQITPWRRAVTGDLTSAFNFATPNDAKVQLPSTISYRPPDSDRHPDYKPSPPAIQALPVQESGVRQVRSGNTNTGPWTYTVGPYAEISDTWAITANMQTVYDLSVYGPNGFLRTFKGSVSGTDKAGLDIRSLYDPYAHGITLEIHNRVQKIHHLRILDAYTHKTFARHLKPGENLREFWRLEDTFGWYDFTVEAGSDPSFQQRLAGHLETGRDSMSDPAIAATQPV